MRCAVPNWAGVAVWVAGATDMLLDPSRSYDLIGDVHGCSRTLEHLLERLGYRKQGGVWRHAYRMALFLGDIIDRGPRIRDALHRVHDMVDAEQAACIMGNHEFYALGWHTPAPAASGRQFVREHIPRHERLIRETQQQFEAYPGEWKAFLAWMQELPLFIDAGRFRLVHACWDAGLIEALRQQYPTGSVDQAFVAQAAVADSFAAHVFDRLLRGTNFPLPHGLSTLSDEGFPRYSFRTKFWEEDPQTYGDIVFQPEALPEQAAQRVLSSREKRQLLQYGEDEPLLFVGHYWRSGRPAPIRKNLACLDYSAVKAGKLVAYRLDQEAQLDPNKFCWVDVQ